MTNLRKATDSTHLTCANYTVMHKTNKFSYCCTAVIIHLIFWGAKGKKAYTSNVCQRQQGTDAFK